jgi:Tfp pilus assembly protein PilN
MRELEFLPDWYPKARRQKRLVMLQSWLAVVLAMGIAVWGVMTHRNHKTRLAQLQSLDAQIAQSQLNLKLRDELQQKKRALEDQQRILARIGAHVEASRVLSRIASLMPEQMSLTDMTIDTIDQVPAADPSKSPDAKSAQGTRRMKVQLQGVAPSDVDLANFLARLSSVPFFEQVTLVEAQDLNDKSGHVMRRFDLSFTMSLGTLGGA